MEKGADIILAAGGDGTINEVVNGMAHGTTPLAILPGGTANVLAVELGLDRQMPRVARRLTSLVPARISIGLLENERGQRYFVLMAGAGLDALIVYNIDAKLKASFGKVAYWMGGFGQFGRTLPEFHVRNNGKGMTCSFALASRVRNYGGDLWIARNASLYSNHFEVVLFEGSSSLPYVKYLAGVLTGRLADMQGVQILRSQSLEIESPSGEGVYLQVDGEYAGRLPARISIVPDALTLMVPEEFQRAHRHG